MLLGKERAPRPGALSCCYINCRAPFAAFTSASLVEHGAAAPSCPTKEGGMLGAAGGRRALLPGRATLSHFPNRWCQRSAVSPSGVSTGSARLCCVPLGPGIWPPQLCYANQGPNCRLSGFHTKAQLYEALPGQCCVQDGWTVPYVLAPSLHEQLELVPRNRSGLLLESRPAWAANVACQPVSPRQVLWPPSTAAMLPYTFCLRF